MKRLLLKLFRGLWYLVWYSLAGSIILVAALFGLARLLLPMIGDYNQDLEQFAEQKVGRPIKIMSLDAEWHGLSPSLVLNNVQLLSKDGKDTLLQVSRARLDFNLYEIIKTKQVQFSRFGLSGANLSLVRLPTGEFALAGFETSAIEPGDGDSEIMDWLLSQGEINLHAKNLIFNDQLKNNKRYNFSNLSVTLRNDADRHMIDGAVAFTERTQQEFAFAIDVVGNITVPDAWSGKMYFRGLNLDITRIFGPIVLAGNHLKIGQSKFEVWSDWRKGALAGIQGDVSLGDVRLRSDESATPLLSSEDKTENVTATKSKKQKQVRTVEYNNIIGRFVWDKYDHGWRVLADNVILVNEHRLWPSSQFSLHYYLDEDSKQRINLQSSLIRMDDVTPLLPVLFDTQIEPAQLVTKYAPSGDIKQINFKWLEAEEKFELAANLQNVDIQSLDNSPGVSGLSGMLKLNNNAGSFKFDTKESNFTLPDVFRWGVPINKINGTVNWERASDSLFISSRDLIFDSAHFQSRAIFDLEVPDSDKSPFLSLIVNFNNADLSKASTFYPVSIMSEGAVTWMDTALVQGELTEGAAIVYGPLDEFPFTKGQGVFDARLKARNIILDYAEDWPKVHEADADVIFRGKTFSIKTEQAKVFDSDVKNLKVTIPDLKADTLKIKMDGKIVGKTQNNINYMLTAPPLREKYEGGLSDLRATGNSQLDIGMVLSVGKEIDADLKGKLTVKDNTLELVQFPDIMDSINGQVSFVNGDFTGKGLKARLLEQPVAVSVSTKKPRTNNKKKFVEYKAVGKFNAKSIAKSQFPLFHDMVDGDANWVVKLLVHESNDDPQLLINTNLKGVSLNLPVPFKKKKSDSRKLFVNTVFRNSTKSMMKVSYSGEYEAILECNFTEDIWLKKGEARFGGGPAVLPDTPGLRIVGDIDEASYDVWDNLIQQFIDLKKKDQLKKGQTSERDSTEPDPYFSLVSAVDLNIKKFEVFGQQDSNARITMDNKLTWLAVNIKSEKFDGNVKIPDNLDIKPLVLDMNKLNITPPEESGTKIDPRNLPAVKLNSRSMYYGNKVLGRVAIETSKQPDGLLVQQLIINPRSTVMKGHGSWVIENDVERANLEFNIDSKNMGKTMKDLGYVGTVADGEGNFTASLEWPSSLLDPDFHQISGKVSMNVEDGRILDIEPGGAARLFGLFSLQTLPRRLTLDFSDLFSKGLKFDSITGDFKIEHGDAYTSNLKLVGPNADVVLRGRIGIGAQDYDQKVRVTPHITDTTILLSVITSQPLLFLFQQLLKQDIDAATSFEYALSGTWDDYKLTPILKTRPEPSEPDEF